MATDRAPATRGDWRVVRGAAVGTAATALSVGGHTLAGGHAPPLAAVAVVGVLLGAAGVGLSRTRWTLPRLLGLLFGAQAGLHAVFAWTSPSAAHGPAGTTGMAGMAGMDGMAHPPHVPEHGAAMLPTNPWMVAAHVVAAIVIAALLRRGDAWLCAVVDALALRAVAFLDRLPTVAAVRPQAALVTAPASPPRDFMADAHGVRGPPR